MVESELSALLDVHDGLVAACVEESIPFKDFLFSYGNFYDIYALDGHEASQFERDLFARYSDRIAFHRRVTRILSGVCTAEDAMNPAFGDAGRFLPAVATMRLKQLVAQCPKYKAPVGDDSQESRAAIIPSARPHR
jgi:hypothetical protein